MMVFLLMFVSNEESHACSGMNLSTHLHLVTRLKMGGAILLLLLYVFMA